MHWAIRDDRVAQFHFGSALEQSMCEFYKIFWELCNKVLASYHPPLYRRNQCLSVLRCLLGDQTTGHSYTFFSSIQQPIL